MKKRTLRIMGMTCADCADEAESVLNALEGVTATVTFHDSRAQVETTPGVALAELLRAIESKGFTAIAENAAGASVRNDSSGEGLHIAIIGSGSGAFAAAIKAVERGAKVTMIEGAELIGGTCVNIGCVPSKIMIRGAHLAHLQKHHNFDGLQANTPKLDRKAMVAQQQAWVEKLRFAKYENILESNPDISLVRGTARFKDPTTLIVTTRDGEEKQIQTDRILIAVGAKAATPNIPGLSETPFWTSTEALIAEEIPKRLTVLGASAVALELAQAYRHLGTDVTLVARSRLLSREDPEVGEQLTQILSDEGINILLETKIESVSYTANVFTMTAQNGIKIQSEQLLVATGREPNTSSLRLEIAGVKTDVQGRVVVNKHMRTSKENIYAVGDCTNQPQFVYVAAAAGTRAGRNMTGDAVDLDLSTMPAVVFTNPQVATVGLTEQKARDQGLDVESRSLSLENVPRALANMDTRGFIKLVAEKNSGRIIGCQILANEAGEIIQTAVLAIRGGMSIEDLANQMFPYLTMVEGLKLTAQTFNKDVKQLSCCAG